MELNSLLYSKIVSLTDEGNNLMDNGFFDSALTKFKNALELIPNPKINWDASYWIYTAIGDAYFCKNEFILALDYFYQSENYAYSRHNPFIQLRIGQCLFEKNDMNSARQYFIRAFSLAGNNIFEDEDPKYIDFYES